MNHAHFLRMKGLSPKTTKSSTRDLMILRAMRHNLREIVAEIGVTGASHIDPQRVKDNIILRGADTSIGVSATIGALLETAKVSKWRHDTISAIELIFSLPSTSKIQYADYFNDSMKWAEKFFAVPLVSAVIHLDEDAPHCHVILIPIVDGWLRGSDVMGDKRNFSVMHKDYQDTVSKHYGIARHAPQKRYSATIRREAINLALATLETNSGLHSDILCTLVEPHFGNPETLLQTLGLSMPQAKSKTTFVGIMTKPCKPEQSARSARFDNARRRQPSPCANPIEVGTQTSIEVAPCAALEKPQPLSCVEVRFPDDVLQGKIDARNDDFKRERETDSLSSAWDYDR